MLNRYIIHNLAIHEINVSTYVLELVIFNFNFASCLMRVIIRAV